MENIKNNFFKVIKKIKNLLFNIFSYIRNSEICKNIITILVTILVFFLIRSFINSNDNYYRDDVKVDIKTCFGNKTIRSDVPLEEYLVGVLYGEENPTDKTSREYLKAFIIFARTYSLKRGGFDGEKNLSIKSCSSDQNWCDYENGCYREQTKEMFNQCINFSLNKNSKNPYYSAKKCANRVTTFSGTKKVTNKTFTVSNANWPSNYAKVATSTANVSVWKRKPTDSYQEYLKEIVKETEGLVIKNEVGQVVTLGYMLCNSKTSGHIMCMNKAKELGNKGYSYEEIIKSYTKDYKNIIIEDYKKNI